MELAVVGIVSSLVVLFLTFVICYIFLTRNNECFKNNSQKQEPFYNRALKDNTPLKGTPVNQISTYRTRRFPYAIETVQNWYNTQPMLPATLGTNMGKDPNNCFDCDKRFNKV